MVGESMSRCVWEQWFREFSVRGEEVRYVRVEASGEWIEMGVSGIVAESC